MDIFSGKIAIVTGGASGIGRAISEQLASRGASVVLADINAELLEETSEAINDAGGKAKTAQLDVRDFEAVKKVVDDTVEENGRLDYIFNNAGIGVAGEAHDVSYDDWCRVIDINLYGEVNGVLAAYPVMVKQGFGHIVNTASLAGLIPVVALTSYTTSKYGIVGLSNALHIEGALHGVKVSVVCPGLIRTPIKENLKFVKMDREKMIESAPEGMNVDECARIILRGVERNKAVILVTLPVKIAYLIQRLSPGLVRLMLRLSLKRTIHTMRVED